MRRFVIVFAISILILVACGTPATQEVVSTNTPPPIPTETDIPPTSTPEPTATPNPLIFKDDFIGSLGEGWQWEREDPKNWNLTSNPGWLEIMAKSGGVYDAKIKNLLLRSAPKGDYEIETQLNFDPRGNFQFGGLIIYQSQADYIQFGRAYCSSPQCAGDGFYLDSVAGGLFAGENYATAAPKSETVYIKLQKRGNNYSGYVSEDGKEWKMIGVHNRPLKPVFVGLLAGQASGTIPSPAQFDYFTITMLP